jgi:hypothetical protein
LGKVHEAVSDSRPSYQYRELGLSTSSSWCRTIASHSKSPQVSRIAQRVQVYPRHFSNFNEPIVQYTWIYPTIGPEEEYRLELRIRRQFRTLWFVKTSLYL